MRANGARMERRPLLDMWNRFVGTRDGFRVTVGVLPNHVRRLLKQRAERTRRKRVLSRSEILVVFRTEPLHFGRAKLVEERGTDRLKHTVAVRGHAAVRRLNMRLHGLTVRERFVWA